MESPVQPPRDPEQRPVFLLGENNPGGVLLDGLPEALQRVPVQQQAAVLVPRSRGPVQHRHQERQVRFGRPVAHGSAAGTDRPRAALPDEAVPIALGQGLRPSVPAEELEEHRHRGPVPLPGLPPLGGRHLLTVDVKELLQGERLRLGSRLAVQVRAGEPGGELVRLPFRPRPVAVTQRPGEPATVLAPLHLEQAGLRVWKHPGPVPAPLAGAVAPAATFSSMPYRPATFSVVLYIVLIHGVIAIAS